MKPILTQNEYQNQFVDFYKQTLGTGIGTTVAKPGDADDKDKDDGSRRPELGGGRDSVFNPMAGTSITGGLPYNATQMDVNNYIKQNSKSAKNAFKTDLSFSGFMDYLKRPQTSVTAVAGVISGLPITAMGEAAGRMNKKLQYETALEIASTGHGNIMDLNGQTVSRKPGSKTYNGVLGNFSSEQLYALEELQKGYIPGTMREIGGSDERGNPENYTVGKSGLLDAATAERLGGNYDAYGNWHSTKYGTVSASGPLSGAKALASQYGVNTTNWTTQDYVNFSNDWKSGAKSSGSTAGGVRGFFENLFSNPLRDSTEAEYRTSLDNVKNSIANYSSDRQEDDDEPQVSSPSRESAFDNNLQESISDLGFDDSYGDDDDNNSGGGTSFGGGTDYGQSIGEAMVAMGGRVGMQAGGVAAQPAGFVQGPPSQFSDSETVADDQPMQVQEGTFVINAPAVEHAGTQDIRKMILDAYTIAREKGLDIGNVDRKIYESTIDVALSKGEVVVPPQLAKIIGYDRLEKINNRGKKEVSRRQQAAEGGFLGLAKGGTPDDLMNLEVSDIFNAPEDPADYEDPIILNEVNRRMQEEIAAAKERGVNVDHIYFAEYDEEGKKIKDGTLDEMKALSDRTDTELITGDFYSDSENKKINAPRTPSLLNFFILAEELHHLEKPKEILDLYDANYHEGRFAEELRAKKAAYETVKGMLPKGKRTKQMTEDRYAKNFLFYLNQAPESVRGKIIESMREEYPELNRVIKQLVQENQADKRFRARANGGFI